MGYYLLCCENALVISAENNAHLAHLLKKSEIMKASDKKRDLNSCETVHAFTKVTHPPEPGVANVRTGVGVPRPTLL